MRPGQYAPHPAHQQLAASENRSQQRYDGQNRSDLDERIYFSLAHATRPPQDGLAVVSLPLQPLVLKLVHCPLSLAPTLYVDHSHYLVLAPAT
jgi:hypothetical protein